MPYKVVYVIRDDDGSDIRMSAMWELMDRCAVIYPVDGQWAGGYHGTPVMVFNTLPDAYQFQHESIDFGRSEIWEVECKNLRKPRWIMYLSEVTPARGMTDFWNDGRWRTREAGGFCRRCPPSGTRIADQVRLVRQIPLFEARQSYVQRGDSNEML